MSSSASKQLIAACFTLSDTSFTANTAVAASAFSTTRRRQESTMCLPRWKTSTVQLFTPFLRSLVHFGHAYGSSFSKHNEKARSSRPRRCSASHGFSMLMFAQSTLSSNFSPARSESPSSTPTATSRRDTHVKRTEGISGRRIECSSRSSTSFFVLKRPFVKRTEGIATTSSATLTMSRSIDVNSVAASLVTGWLPERRTPCMKPDTHSSPSPPRELCECRTSYSCLWQQSPLPVDVPRRLDAVVFAVAFVPWHAQASRRRRSATPVETPCADGGNARSPSTAEALRGEPDHLRSASTVLLHGAAPRNVATPAAMPAPHVGFDAFALHSEIALTYALSSFRAQSDARHRKSATKVSLRTFLGDNWSKRARRSSSTHSRQDTHVAWAVCGATSLASLARSSSAPIASPRPPCMSSRIARATARATASVTTSAIAQNRFCQPSWRRSRLNSAFGSWTRASMKAWMRGTQPPPPFPTRSVLESASSAHRTSRACFAKWSPGARRKNQRSLRCNTALQLGASRAAAPRLISARSSTRSSS